MNIKRVLIGVFVLFLMIVFAGTFISCEKRSKQEVKFEKALKKAIKSDKKTIDLKELTDFEWEKVCFFNPYFPNAECGGVRWDSQKKSDCLDDDTYWGMLFVDKNKNAIPICIKRKIVDYSRESLRCTIKKGATGSFTEENWGSKERPVMRKVLSIQGEKCSDSNDLEKIMIKR